MYLIKFGEFNFVDAEKISNVVFENGRIAFSLNSGKVSRADLCCVQKCCEGHFISALQEINKSDCDVDYEFELYEKEVSEEG